MGQAELGVSHAAMWCLRIVKVTSTHWESTRSGTGVRNFHAGGVNVNCLSRDADDKSGVVAFILPAFHVVENRCPLFLGNQRRHLIQKQSTHLILLLDKKLCPRTFIFNLPNITFVSLIS